jgi:hypothetical protein
MVIILSNFTFSLRYGVVEVALVERVAAGKTAKRHPSALQSPVFVDSFVSVGRASGPESAAGRGAGRNMTLIKPNEGKTYFFHRLSSFNKPSFSQAER